ncbi:DUF6134 family protein [Azospirillum picis]|uniref:DUF3108 domain-containing protein n=1 Tax=Azospirillum picis TaxID=488438 RepID=A0ABU0MVI4_9PROT|nr:DUF6134 family protein [Azospirillum picis]MBP2303477.1 hypothetical protein [Azospirillum picis]MDQ0537334.1 hypothetical protein [Azospirillum picis]
MTMTRALRATLAAALMSGAGIAALLPAGAASAAGTPTEGARSLTYQILMGEDPIGTEQVRIEPLGDRTRVTVVATTRVKVLFINFRYDHKREEVWKGGALESMTATTDDDGTPHSMSLTRDGGGYRMTVDGKAREVAADALPLTLWTPEVLKHRTLLSVIDGAPYKAAARKVGAETVEAGGKAVPAAHHRIDGDVERELWYAADGTLLKTRFKRSGYDITYVLK